MANRHKYRIKEMKHSGKLERRGTLSKNSGIVCRNSIVYINETNLILGSPLVLEYIYATEDSPSEIYYVIRGEIRQITHPDENNIAIETENTIYELERIL